MDGLLELRRMRRGRLAAVPQRPRRADELDARARRAPRARAGRGARCAAVEARRQPRGEPFHVRVGVGGHDLGSASRCIVAIASAFADSVVPRPEWPGGFSRRMRSQPRGNRIAEAPDARRHAAGDRLAEHEQVGLEPVQPRVAAGAGWRSCASRRSAAACRARASARRSASWKPGLGQHHAAVGQHRLGDDAGDVARCERRAPAPRRSLNSTTRVVSGQIAGTGRSARAG